MNRKNRFCHYLKKREASNTSFRQSSVFLCLFLLSFAPYTLATPGEKIPDRLEVQQSRKRITGVVTESHGDPLPGVTVQVLGRQGGVITDAEGRYTIEAAPNEELRFQFVGMKPQTISVGNLTTLNVVMVEDVELLDEVTITAFATQKKESIVSSIETISPKQLRVPSSNLTTALAGRLAGVISYQRSGEPGNDNAQFFVRGVTTFGYASSPLILLDGFEVSSTDLARVDPDNIEQFAVLKDATAAALYGSKGANGVIMVTTKKGVAGKPKISFRADARLSAPTKVLETVDGVTYMNLYNEAQFNDNPLLEPYYSAQKIQNTIDNLNEYAYPNLDWYDIMFKPNTVNQHYNLNITGGGTVVKYYLSVSYDKDTGILRDNKLNNFKNNISIDRFNILTNVTMDLTPTTKMDINMNSIFENFTGPLDNTNEIFASVVATNPVEFPKFYLPDEKTAFVKHTLFGSDATGSMVNPFARMVRGYKDGSMGRITSQFSIDQDMDAILEGLMARAKVSIKSDNRYENYRSYDPYLYNIKSYDEFTDTYVLQQVHKGTDALGNPTITRDGEFRVYMEGGLTYANSFNEMHDISGLLIYTQEESKNTGIYRPEDQTIQRTLPQRNQGLRARLNYGFLQRYLAEVSLTYTGSEKFDKSHRWGVFPAFGVGYILSNEPFWSSLENALPNLKLKYSWGRVGNDQIAGAADRFFFLSDISSGGGYRWGKDFNSYYGGFNINRYANPMITWEIAQKQNIGFEVDIFRNRTLKLILEYFTEDRKQIYQARANLPATMGLTSNVYGNVGAVKSAGWDGSIDLNHSFNKDAWITGRFNFTFAQNEYVENEEPEYRWPYLSDIGWPINTWKGYIAERLFIDQADVDNSPRQELGSIPQAGDIKYKDINGDGRVNSDDQVHIGYPTVPEINYGFGLSGGYKNFDLSCFFQGQDRVSFFIDPNARRDDRFGIAPFADHRGALKIIADDHWNPNNPVSHAFWPRLSATVNQNNSQQNSTWWLRNGRFLRLKTLEIGYTFPEKWYRPIPFSLVRLYFTGQNLFNLSEFKLWDPEMGGNGLAYPLQRVYNVGLNVTF
ncbi:SusC/RagA family TonB-linked outer membrane protein [Petrimonas mucosa]|jgi:TonB-linked SusC/RagA family outer membrane protein|uniref:SusC/RagA family TonB-linked outer membrane protein n=2 Tax=Petrimonas TaxID=307628 RepID=UPI00176F3D0F|nr:TonB-dependent receptor [Petrimonas mucosa]MDD3561894.1 TonB-dependent receptor [Petrimonas mucosa]HHT29468.1 TonB-dependent receptor [Petrimonas mucosa]